VAHESDTCLDSAACHPVRTCVSDQGLVHLATLHSLRKCPPQARPERSILLRQRPAVRLVDQIEPHSPDRLVVAPVARGARVEPEPGQLEGEGVRDDLARVREGTAVRGEVVLKRALKKDLRTRRPRAQARRT
jgi:hypothetical protein